MNCVDCGYPAGYVLGPADKPIYSCVNDLKNWPAAMRDAAEKLPRCEGVDERGEVCGMPTDSGCESLCAGCREERAKADRNARLLAAQSGTWGGEA